MIQPIAALLLAVCFNAASANDNNAALKKMFDADQKERDVPSSQMDVATLNAHDRAREAAVRLLVRDSELHTADDFFNAAVIMQHGLESDDYRLAYSLATIATHMDPKNALAKWLTAATWDRLMISLGRRQWYGTQYQTSKSGATALLPLEPDAVSALERIRLGVPSSP